MLLYNIYTKLFEENPATKNHHTFRLGYQEGHNAPRVLYLPILILVLRGKTSWLVKITPDVLLHPLYREYGGMGRDHPWSWIQDVDHG